MNHELDKATYASKLRSIKTMDKIKFHNYLVDLLNIRSDHKVLDLGCGHGNTLMYISEKLGNEGKAVGIDLDQNLLLVAEKLLRENIANGRLDLMMGDISKGLPFEKNTFDSIVCHNVLECIPDKTKLINNSFDVLKKGGIMVVSHSDFDSQIFNSSFPELSRRLVHHYSDTTQEWMAVSDGAIGRRLRGIFSKTKFTTYTPLTYTMTNYRFGPREYGYRIAQDIIKIAKRSDNFSREELKVWFNDLKEKDRNSEYYYSSMINLIVAKK
ncbi:MAG: methyltransferase domain-containing protein [Caldilineaceae bacterium]